MRWVYKQKKGEIDGGTEFTTAFRLSQNYPNPSNPETTIKYKIPKLSKVMVTIYNVTGQLVKIFTEGIKAVGHNSIEWNGKDDTGNDVATGVYFYQLIAKDISLGSTQKFVSIRKMLLVR